MTDTGGDTLEEGENTGAVETSGGDAPDWVSPANGSSISAGDTSGNDNHTAGDAVRVTWQDTNDGSSAHRANPRLVFRLSVRRAARSPSRTER